MKKLAILVAAAAAVGLFGFASSPAGAATTLVVDEDGKGILGDCDDDTATFATIGAAVAVAGTSDTIFVCPGTYDEKNLHIDEEVTIEGSGTTSTIVDFIQPESRRSKMATPPKASESRPAGSSGYSAPNSTPPAAPARSTKGTEPTNSK